MLICFAYEWAFFKGARMEQDDFLARKEQILNRNSAKNFKEFNIENELKKLPAKPGVYLDA